jgi:hypothetical protein
MAMRFLAQRANGANGGPGQLPGGLSNPAVSAALANFMTAARNGNVDPNDPQMAHFRQMILMQQQQQLQGQVKDGKGQDGQGSAPAQGQTQGQGAATGSQAQQQAQTSAQSQSQGTGTGTGASTGQGQAAGGQGGKGKVWSGEIVWPTQGATGAFTISSRRQEKS